MCVGRRKLIEINERILPASDRINKMNKTEAVRRITFRRQPHLFWNHEKAHFHMIDVIE